MLADKFLPVYHFKIFHEIAIRDHPVELHQILHAKIDHWLIRLLFHVRGIRISGKEMDVGSMGFTLLEETEGGEIAYGIISKSQYFNSCLGKFSPEDFTGKFKQGYLRGLIVFGTKGTGNEKILFTETRVHCGSQRIYNRFRGYWFFVKPFSSMIRAIILGQLKRVVITKNSF